MSNSPMSVRLRTESSDTFVWRDRILFGLLGLGIAALLAVLALRILKETGGTNAYALVAQSLMTATPYASTCFGADCALFHDKTYIVFPPFPGLLAMPLVMLRGLYTTGFVAITAALFAGSLLLWRRLFRFFGLSVSESVWLLAAIGFASPLYYVTLRGDGVWFFAQATAFFLVTLALHEAMVGRRFLTAGLALGAAFLCRQMSIFYLPLIFIFATADEPLFAITKRRFLLALDLGLPVAGALIIYFLYNFWRFGDPLNTGYNYINFAGSGGVLEARVGAYGLWNKAYLLFNLFYMFIQGFHAEFAEPQFVSLSGMDKAGTSILAASPWLLLLFFARADRKLLAVLVMMAGFTGMLLFYHSNGFSQYNVQRYCLDWLPAALLLIAPLLNPERLTWARLLIVWGVWLNVATVAVLGLTHTAT